MIKVFYGDDRVRAQQEIVAFLGADYEVVEGGDLTPEDLPTLFFGASLFVTERAILVRDFWSNRAVADLLPQYVDTPHRVAMLEAKVDKRSAAYKDLAKNPAVEFREFKLPEKQDFRAVFDVYRTAKRDGARAVKMLEGLKSGEEPIMFAGLLASQAIKDFAARPTGVKERRILRELARTDMQMKTTAVEPWLLVESFLLRMSQM